MSSFCSGRIWLDNVRCSSFDEVLEDCTFNRWGVHNCDHDDDVGVVCYPGQHQHSNYDQLYQELFQLSSSLWEVFSE